MGSVRQRHSRDRRGIGATGNEARNPRITPYLFLRQNGTHDMGRFQKFRKSQHFPSANLQSYAGEVGWSEEKKMR